MMYKEYYNFRNHILKPAIYLFFVKLNIRVESLAIFHLQKSKQISSCHLKKV